MESNGDSISQIIKENLKNKDCVNLESISPKLPLKSPNFKIKQIYLNKDVLISEEEFKNIFGCGNKTEQTVLGPKVNLTYFQECDFNESIDLDIEENSVIMIMDYDINKNTSSVSESEVEEPEIKGGNKNDNSVKNRVTTNNKEEKLEDSKFSIKVEGSAKRGKFPSRYKNILANSNNNLNTDGQGTRTNQNTTESRIEKVGCFGCFTTARKVKNTNMSSLSNHKDYTKRSTNISIKSLKMNDSLTKHRKRKNKSPAHTDEITTSKMIQKSNTCRCMIF